MATQGLRDHEFGRRQRGRDWARARRTNAVEAPAATATAPPYRYHLPAVVLVMITLPCELGIASTNETTSQPSAGSRPPAKERRPQPHSTQVAKITRLRRMATSGTGLRLYWKLPISPCMAPSTSSTR